MKHSHPPKGNEASPRSRELQISVAFRHLGCHGVAPVSQHNESEFGYFAALAKHIRRAVCGPQKGDTVQILQDLEGLILPGETLLALGRTGSGCSTFLKALSGDISGLKLSDRSDVNYQGTSYSQFHRRFKGERIYVAELDVHFPELTLGQTLGFAVSARQPGKATQGPASQAATHFGLEKAMDTPVGDVLIPGLSGGEKRRASIAEAYIGGAQLQCWDNSTRGLDSRTASRFVSFLRAMANVRKSTIAMSLYQMSEGMYEKFDKVILLYEGRQIYFGPAAKAADYFIKMGFVRPERATTADFLTSLTSPEQRIIHDGFEDRVPRRAEEFASLWKSSDESKALRHEIDNLNSTHPVMDRSVPAEDLEQLASPGKLTSANNTFTLSLAQQTILCLSRAWLRLMRTMATEISGLVANLVLGVIIGSVFYNLDETTNTLQRRAILLFFALMVNAFVPAAEINKMWAQRPIVEKQYRYAFYHPVTERLASVICDMPAKVLICFAIHLPLYFMANLRREVAAFFIYWLFMFVNIVVMSMLFRMIGSISRTHMQTMVPMMVAILLCVLYTGFILPPDYMRPWLAWFWRINPLAYTYQSLLINEMRNRRFPCPEQLMIPGSSAYKDIPLSSRMCTSVGSSLGETDVDGSEYIALKYNYHENQLWRNLGILIGMMVVFFIAHLVTSQYILAQPSKGEVLTFRHGSRSKRYNADDQPNDPQKVTVVSSDDQEQLSSTKPNPDIRQVPRDGDKATQTGCFHWANITYEVRTKREERTILNNVNGWVQPGTLTALMGVSGAGKTTLLNILADRVSTGHRSGIFYVDGQSRDRSFQRKVGYVQQEDIHLATQTVRETLRFSAQLRQPESTSTHEKLAYVETVLDMLGMQDYGDAIVGVPGEGLNIEQRRRLTIAVELVAKPELLIFLDEPTSGLDSDTAWSICTLLRDLVNKGHTILCTIHQPSAQILNMFDRILLLSNIGCPIYFGEVGSNAGTLIRYFGNNGARPCAPGENPAEWMLEVTETSPSSTTVTTDGQGEKVSNWADLWANSPENREVLQCLKNMKPTGTTLSWNPKTEEGEYAMPQWTQLLLVSNRIFQEQLHDSSYLLSKLLLSICMALINGISFYNSSRDIQGTTNLLFSIFLITQMFTCISRVTVPYFISGRTLFETRERHSKTYHWSVFIGATVLVEIFWQTVVAAPIFASWYYPTGLARNGDAALSTAERGAASFVLVWLFLLWVSTISQMFAALLEHIAMAMDLCILFYWLVLVFCGVLATPDELPRFWIFMYRISPLTYFLEGLTVAGMYNSRITCSSIEELHLPLPLEAGVRTCGEYLSALSSGVGGEILNPTSTGDCRFCPAASVNALLQKFGMTVNLWRDVGLMVVYVVFNIAATFGLYWLARVPKKQMQGKKN